MNFRAKNLSIYTFRFVFLKKSFFGTKIQKYNHKNRVANDSFILGAS